MTRLKQLLEEFASKPHINDDIANDFKKIAEEILFGGCFVVKKGKEVIRRIRIVDVEGYFHSEKEGKDEIHDYIMYHRNHKNKPDLDYLPVGTFYPHVSGIDLTFESERNKFRASMLLRSYQFVDENNNPIIKVQIYPTHLYDDMFSGFTPFNDGCTIEWTEDKSFNNGGNCIKQTYRKNVSEYNNGSEDKEPEKRKLKDNENLVPTENYKDIVQDLRPWRFYISSLKQELKIKDLEKQ